MSKFANMVPLDRPPVIEQMGVSVHGQERMPIVERYRLPHLWCLHLYRYDAVLELDGRAYEISPGSASVVSPNTHMTYRYRGLSEHIYCHFQLHTSDSPVPIPEVQNLERRFAGLDGRLREAALTVAFSGSRQEAAVWDILWTLATVAEPMQTQGSPQHPIVGRALDLIEGRLGDAISVEGLTLELGTSYSYLSKLFRVEFDETVVGYVRRRRAERAEHLLRSSTLPIKSIADTVGIHDLQQFNRLIHRSFGCSPRELRNRN